MLRPLCLLIVTFLLLFSANSALFAQGMLVNASETAEQLPRVDRRPTPVPPIGSIPPVRPQPVVQQYTITAIEVDAKVTGSIAEVEVSQTFKNIGNRQMEVSFVFPLPYDGAIDRLTFLIDGREYPGELMNAREARSVYEAFLRRNEDPALLEWIGTGMFRTSVFPVPAGESRTVTLRYTQLLRMDHDIADFIFPLSTARYTARPVEKLTINVHLEGDGPLKNIYSPTHQVNIERHGERRAMVSFSTENIVPSNDFRLLFDTGTGSVAARVISFRPDDKEDGFFMLLASPRFADDADAQPLPKTVVFVLDNSGSMSGAKIVQARESLKFVLNNLNEGDLFNIVVFNSQVVSFKPELQIFNEETRREAIAYADAIRAGGGTNINEAMRVAFTYIQDSETPSYVLFMTDGVPTSGETREMQIAENTRQFNRHDARMFVFGVGYDLNARLLNRMARDNRGLTEFVRPDEDIEESVSRLYRRISSPILTDTTFEIMGKVSESRHVTNRVFPSGNFDLFAGEQLVLVGRYSVPGDIEIQVTGMLGGNEKSYQFTGNFVEKSVDQTHAYIERLWAIRRIGEILDALDLRGENKELVDELIALSMQHGILTPYTSFLADDTVPLATTGAGRAANVARASDEAMQRLRVTEGAFGVGMRAAQNHMQVADNLQAFGSSQMEFAAAESAAPARPMASSAFPAAMAPAQPLARGGGFGGGGMMGGGAGSGWSTPMPMAEAPAPALAQQQARVQTVNNRAFFQRGDVWVDSTLTEEQQAPENVIVVERFSEEYFALIAEEGRELAQFLIFDEPVLLNFRGQAFRF